jgi:phosphoglucomutase
VLRVEDYLSDETQAMGYPASDLLRFIFENGWVAVRPSGTEPKCKFYYSIKASSEEEAKARLAVLKDTFEPKNA